MIEALQIGIIGGSGLYNMPELKDVERIQVDTPFGKPSGDLIKGTLRGKRVVFLPRHGEGHIHPPAAIPQKANIYALKTLGVRYIIAVNACGSLQEAYAPGHIVVPDQLFDYCTGNRARSFFDEGIAAHISVAEPFDNYLRSVMVDAVEKAGGVVHRQGTLLVEDGPRFATKAESHIFRNWGCDIIGMTTIPEAFLAREAEIAYASMAHITDYDSWHEEEGPVTVEKVMETFAKNIELAQKSLANTVEKLDSTTQTSAHTALDGTIMTARDKISATKIEALRPIIQRSLGLST